MKTFVCACGREFSRSRALRWHQLKFCTATAGAGLKTTACDARTECAPAVTDADPPSAAIADLQPLRDVTDIRKSVLQEIRARATILKETLGFVTPRPVPDRRHQGSLFPAAVPRWQPPFPLHDEIERVKKALFTEH